MISDYSAGQLHFAGVGAEGDSAATAATRLAEALRAWTAAHEECRIVQLSVTGPAVGGTRTGAATYALAAMIAYVEVGLSTADAAQAVAAAVDEIHEAQSGEVGREQAGLPDRPFV